MCRAKEAAKEDLVCRGCVRGRGRPRRRRRDSAGLGLEVSGSDLTIKPSLWPRVEKMFIPCIQNQSPKVSWYPTKIDEISSFPEEHFLLSCQVFKKKTNAVDDFLTCV